MDASQALNKSHKLSALVVGDVMLDAYLIGDVNRISPEAPVPVVDVKMRDRRLGGAANVARNLLALGAKVHVASVIGADEPGNKICQLLESKDIGTSCLVSSAQRPTTVKTRIISNGQQLLRVDEETVQDITEEASQELLHRCIALMEQGNVDVLIFEDYDKGVLTAPLITALIGAAKSRGIKTAVDPKLNQFHTYVGVDLFKPNLKELREGMGLPIAKNDDAGIEQAIEALTESHQMNMALVTLSERGVWIHAPKHEANHIIIPAFPREINDVSGAGDTVIAVASLMLACDVSPVELAAISNLAGGLVCEKVGVVPINQDQLRLEWESQKHTLASKRLA